MDVEAVDLLRTTEARSSAAAVRQLPLSSEYGTQKTVELTDRFLTTGVGCVGQ